MLAARCGTLLRLFSVVRKVLNLLNCLDRARQALGVSLAVRPLEEHLNRSVLLRYVVLDCQGFLDIKKCNHLSPYKDDSGIIRVGGRLRNAFIPFEGKHPILIPEESSFADLLVRHFHQHVVHQGRMLTHSALRRGGFYIPRARRKIESHIRACGTCRRLRGKPVVPPMADLPIERLHETPVFTYA